MAWAPVKISLDRIQAIQTVKLKNNLDSVQNATNPPTTANFNQQCPPLYFLSWQLR